MFLILQETVFQDQVLKSSSLSKKQAEKCKFIKARHLLDTSYLSRFKKETEILIYFLGILECVFETYFRSCYIREYKENIWKRWPMPYSLWKKSLRLCTLGFCNHVLLDLHYLWSEELCSQQSSSSWCVSHVLGAVHLWLVIYWDPCIKMVAFIYWRVQRFWSGRRFLL